MRGFGGMRFILSLILLSGVMAPPVSAQERSPVPERRLSYADGVDLVGRDLSQIFDTSLRGCAAACLADAQCQAVTFNARNNSCFPKADVTGTAPYAGAVSGQVLTVDAAVLDRARARLGDLDFLSGENAQDAYGMARDMGLTYLTGFATPEQIEAELRAARARQDLDRAQELQGALIVLTDASERWTDFAALELARDGDSWRARLAAVNGYLRAASPAAQAEALNVLSRALERGGDTRAMIAALERAVALSPRADLAEALADAQGKYGFRITEHQIESDGASPRICAVFSEDLARSGTDYASFVQLPATGLSVEAEANRICVEGLSRGERHTLTFRKGLPDAAGDALAKDVPITGYIRDRAPMVTFPGRAYILPRGADAGVPVNTVNATSVELRLLRVSDRNLVAAMRADYFATALDRWDQDDFSDRMAEEVWKGSADVGMEMNREVTTRLPVQEVTGTLGAGVYALIARIPGEDSYDNPPAMQWFVVSDLGMTSFSGTDGLTVAVRQLSDAAPAAGVQVTLVSRANAVIAEAVTDPEGVAHFDAALTAGNGNAAPALVSVTRGDDMSFLSLTDAEFDLSDRGVAGLPPAPPIDVFLTTDRGAYRAGETVNATILARDAEVQALPQVPMTAVLVRPDGVEYHRQIAAEAGAGGHVVSFPLLGSAPRGTWRLDVYADPKAEPLASSKLLVEDFLPEKIDFDLTLPEGVLTAEDIPQLAVDARYLFGAPGADLAIEGDVRLTAASALPGYEGFRFGRYDEPFSPVYDSLPPDATDEDGKALLDIPLPEAARMADRPLTARVILRLSEASGRPVERDVARPLMPAESVIGIRPMFDDILPQGAEARFQIVALGPDVTPVALKAHWRLNRIERQYQWYALDGRWNWEPVIRRTRVAEGALDLDGTAPQEVAATTSWGEYELVVEADDPQSYAASSVSFDAGWFAPADVAASPDRLQMSLDKPAYRAGETAHLRIVAPSDGVALVSVLSNRVISLQSVAVTAGENGVDLPVTEEWGAGAYVTASVIRPLAAQAPDRAPDRALGLGYAAVDPGARRLTATLQAPEASDPRAPLPVTLKVEGVAPGETAYATIAAVDVGILNLTAFKSPDPAAHYFGQRRLGVGLRDLYGRLIDGQAGAEGTLRSGGDAAAGTTEAPPPTEELVAYFSGPLTVGADGTVTTQFDMPSFNGTVRLMAVVWSQTGIGQAAQDVLVRDPVVVSASVPRFLAPGDSSRLLLDLHHTSGPSGRMGIEVISPGLTLGEAPAEVTLEDQGRAVIEVPLTAPAAEGVHEIRVALTTPDGKRLDKTLTVPVEANDPTLSRQSRFDLAPGQTFTFDADVFAGFRAGSARSILAAGPIARFDAPAVLAALDSYPYGCTEQVTSKAMPLLYLSSIATAMGLATPADLPARIDGAIARVLTNQDGSGAFGLWRPESGDGWLDAYVTDFLGRARRAGHAVPDQAFRSALDNLRNQVNYAPDFDRESNGGGALLAYQLMVLAREGAAAVGDLRYYADVKGDDFATPMAAAQLGAALASYGDPARADAMFARAGRMISAQAAERAVWRVDYGSALRDRAAVLALAQEAGSTAIDSEAIGASVTQRLGQVPLSTQESVWVLMAASAMIDRPGAGGLTIDGQTPAGPVVSMIDAETAGRSVAIANGGAAAQTLTLTTLGVPEVAEPAGGNGWQIARSYYTTEGEPVDIAHVAQGTRLVTVVEVTPLGPQAARLMISDPLPAGFEIDNPNLIRGGDLAGLDWLDVLTNTRMTEFRQDRFLAAVDWQSDQPFRLAYIVRAVSPGTFRHPAASVEDMYRPEMRAHGDTSGVVIE
ncbi:alpha-2-macroglobulin family protein [Sinirhodobacter populi]|uniref:Alpha-2-macroglobulin family protein n=1 Tax=Paenirhodobacter populi TaxID=2306993 RepID=A0A443KBX3_9RHOB|nr:alpha-2-macroglobulin family protein [Sinirhodobacter populi]RWR30225.1 alpha-2-macroglobulin family protein [Sinirhodobacter populi]